ncbi:MAG: VWA domain-containing protein [Myxococcales bacterium]|nr:VWA domain-containing protein [Myxococcales bacterium]
MSFLAPLGLLLLALVAGPLVAHLLRRRRPEERDFPAARLVPTAPPLARRRANLEDRSLLALRVLAIAALAFVAASPLVRCTRVSLDRRGGASVALAIVLDDSMSMNAELPADVRRAGARTRFELAMVAAREIESSLRSGDAVTIVIASAPARVVLAPTQERGAIRATLEAIARDGASHRGTDLDGALALASSALSKLPQPDRRVVLLSDLSDGKDAPLALGDPALRLEFPLDALTRAPPQGQADCGLLAASPEGTGEAVRVRLVCATPDVVGPSRNVDIVAFGTDTKAGSLALPLQIPKGPFEVVVPVDRKLLPSLDPVAGHPGAIARLSGKPDAIVADDETPVLGSATMPVIGIVVGEGGALDQVVATGGAPVLERALEAVEQGKVSARPLPSAPERDLDLAPLSGLSLDDLAGLGPEARTALAHWVERGGVLLLSLGARAVAPALGASFEPFLTRPLHTQAIDPKIGVDPSLAGPFGDGAEPPVSLEAKVRVTLSADDLKSGEVRAKFSDGAPLLVVRKHGQGEVWLLTLPLSPDASDLPLRPAFLAFVGAFADRAADRGAGVRLTIGSAFSVGPDDGLEVAPLDPKGNPLAPLPLEPAAVRVRPHRLGAYLVTVSPKGASPFRDVRAVMPVEAEVDLRPRPLAPAAAAGQTSGMQRTTQELSPTLAALVCLLAAIELLIRVRRLFSPPPEPAAET